MTNLIRKALSILNFFFVKSSKRVVLLPFPNTEPASINIANELVVSSDCKVYLVIENEGVLPRDLLLPQVRIVQKSNRYDYRYLWYVYRSKFLFITHGCVLTSFPKRQVVVNLWHGLLYKRVGLLDGKKGIPSKFTIGTSTMTQKMLSEAFGVDKESVMITGYPRNDSLLKGKKNKEGVINKLSLNKKYSQIILWMPTYRKALKGDVRVDGIDVGNPFYIRDFDIERFNGILQKNDTLCIVKPHPMAPKYRVGCMPSHLLFIDDRWVYDKGLDLYEFVGATDILISDVSSIVIDYMLLNNPVVCVSEDFEAYRQSRGFYFEDIEEKIPSDVLTTQEDFFNYLSDLLETGADPCKEKREALRDLFFQYCDDHATKRVIAATMFN